MGQEHTESGGITIWFDANVDAKAISDTLATYRPRSIWTRYIELRRSLPVGYESLSNVPLHKAKDGLHRITLSSYVHETETPDWLDSERINSNCIEISVESRGENTSKVVARSPAWCANALFFVLIGSPQAWQWIGSLLPVLPAIDDVWMVPPVRKPYHRVVVVSETDVERMANWLLRRTSDVGRYEEYSRDGSGYKLIAGVERSDTSANIQISVGGWLISKSDGRGRRAALQTTDLIVAEIESLSATRSKVAVSVSEERFSKCYFDVLAELGTDFPETRAAVDAAGTSVDESEPSALNGVSPLLDLGAAGYTAAPTSPPGAETSPKTPDECPSSPDDPRLAHIKRRRTREIIAMWNAGKSNKEIKARFTEFTNSRSVTNLITELRKDYDSLILRKR